jgi:RHS repeat-associated protein
LPVLELDSTVAIAAINTFDANGLLSRRTGGVSGTSVFYTFDHQGNVCQRFDRTANLLTTDQYSAFGSLLLHPTNDVFGFGGQWGYYTDAETGLLLLTNRYYDPASGRFLNRDPLSYAGRINLYGHVGGNPVNFADPLELVSGATVVIVGGGACCPERADWCGHGRGAR